LSISCFLRDPQSSHTRLTAERCFLLFRAPPSGDSGALGAIGRVAMRLDFPGAAVDDLGKSDYAALLSSWPLSSTPSSRCVKPMGQKLPASLA
jgi:hypothetical protein